MENRHEHKPLKIEMITDLDKLTTSIFKNNFHMKYDELKSILLRYNEKGFDKKEIIALLNEYYETKSNNFSIYQDEVFIEIFNRLYGYCSPLHKLELF